MLQASIFEVNTASIQLHKKVGFHVIGVRKGIARKNDQWQQCGKPLMYRVSLFIQNHQKGANKMVRRGKKILITLLLIFFCLIVIRFIIRFLDFWISS